MKDSINQKITKRKVHAIDSARGIPNHLVEERCINARSRSVGNRCGSRKFMRKVSMKQCFTVLVRYYAQNPDFYEFLRRQYILEQKINFYMMIRTVQASLSVGQLTASRKSQSNAIKLIDIALIEPATRTKKKSTVRQQE